MKPGQRLELRPGRLSAWKVAHSHDGTPCQVSNENEQLRRALAQAEAACLQFSASFSACARMRLRGCAYAATLQTPLAKQCMPEWFARNQNRTNPHLICGIEERQAEFASEALLRDEMLTWKPEAASTCINLKIYHLLCSTLIGLPQMHRIIETPVSQTRAFLQRRSRHGSSSIR